MIDKTNKINTTQLNQKSNSLSLRRTRSRRLASTRGIKWCSSDLDILQTNDLDKTQNSGWIRLFAGPCPNSTNIPIPYDNSILNKSFYEYSYTSDGNSTCKSSISTSSWMSCIDVNDEEYNLDSLCRRTVNSIKSNSSSSCDVCQRNRYNISVPVWEKKLKSSNNKEDKDGISIWDTWRTPSQNHRCCSGWSGDGSSSDTFSERGSCWEFLEEKTARNISSLVELDMDTTVCDLTTLLSLPNELTIYVQVGGEESRRLDDNSNPLMIQDTFLQRLGYDSGARRERLGIDPDLSHLVRFHLGPAVPLEGLDGVKQCGSVYILKGLAFPQWKLRPLAIVGGLLLIYPGCLEGSPEVIHLSTTVVHQAEVRGGKFVMQITLAPCASPTPGEPPKNIFLGFDRDWERDLWHVWLLEGSSVTTSISTLNLSGSGLQKLPETILTSLTGAACAADTTLHDVDLSRNRLRDSAALAPLVLLREGMRSLSLAANRVGALPEVVCQFNRMVKLDLSDNCLKELPDQFGELVCLEELRLERNELARFPDVVHALPRLRLLDLADNHIDRVPEFMTMRASILSDNLDINNGEEKKLCNKSSLARVNLRSNKLKGSIILGNYGCSFPMFKNLTHLDVSENHIETLDLSALDRLEALQCSRNRLVELSLNGSALKSIIAGNNELKKINISPAPIYLEHIDLSHNSLGHLPTWICDCPQLRSVFGSHNLLASLPENMFSSELSKLRTIQLGYNKLTSLPSLPRQLPVQELFLQNNSLGTLPDNFFSAFHSVKVLNLSNNRLCRLPSMTFKCPSLERMYITANCLVDDTMLILKKFINLRLLYAAYNCFNTLPDICISSWPNLEELVLSGNSLQYIPDNITNLQNLTVLRIHSNMLQSCPQLSKLHALKVLDLAHNQLDRINLVSLVPKQLQFLDLSCNTKLHVDSDQFQNYRTQRPMSLVDVSGQNRTSLPSVPRPFHEGGDAILEPPWKVGFSETSGSKPRLYVTQLRLPSFCNTEGLFGIFDGENNNMVPTVLEKSIPRILLEERTMKETSNQYMKYTMLSAHRELREKGQKHGVSATLIHICRTKATSESFIPSARKYVLRVASVGLSKVVLYRRTGPVCLTLASPRRQLGCSSEFPLVVPDPEVTEINLDEDDEFVVVANKNVWDVISVEAASEEVRAQSNAILAAKRIQDLAQSYGAEENLSVVVVRLQLSGGVDQLMRELRNTIRKNKNEFSPNVSEVCQCSCCCDAQRACVHCAQISSSKRTSSDDRSSPSGQSDQNSEVTVSARSFQNIRLPMNPPPKMGVFSRPNYESQRKISSERRSCRGGVAKAVRARVIEEKDRNSVDESDAGLSEEQYKCWEYMLEQNTQLLFDKELDTISKGVKRTPRSRLSNCSLSRSSPQLADTSCTGSIAPFLSKHFGSARSFNPLVTKSNKMASYLNGGPNAAYFGSLQRLMPYNLEYDFAVIQERGNNLDSLDFESRMQQYWGVATTEL